MFFSGIRIDLLLQYAFVRYSDNIMDDASNLEDKKLKLKLLQKYIGECFADRKSDYDVKSVPHEVNINWTPYESSFNVEEMACLRALSRIAFFLPRKPYEEVLAGYECDLTNKIYKTEKDIIDYFILVAGSFSGMCIYSFLYRFNIDKYELVEKDDYVIKKAYQLGNVSHFLLVT